MQNLYVSSTLICGESTFTFTVSAFDEESIRGQTSNSVRFQLPCVEGQNLAAGAIAGITIGCILLLILILIILCICCNWKRRNDLTIWKCLSCSCLQEKEKQKQTSETGPSNDSGNRVKQIRTIADLTRNSTDVQKKSETVQNEGFSSRTGTDNPGFDDFTNPISDTGFNGHPYKGNSKGDKGSFASYPTNSFDGYNSVAHNLKESTLQTTLPINQVGIPVVETWEYDHATVPSFLDNEFNSSMITSPYNTNEVPPRTYTPSTLEASRHTPVQYVLGASSPNTLTTQRLNTQV